MGLASRIAWSWLKPIFAPIVSNSPDRSWAVVPGTADLIAPGKPTVPAWSESESAWSIVFVTRSNHGAALFRL